VAARARSEGGVAEAEAPNLELVDEAGTAVLYLGGAWRVGDAERIASDVAGLALAPGAAIVIDGSRLAEMDTSAAFVLLSRLPPAADLRVRAMGVDEERLIGLVQRSMHAAPVRAKLQRRGLVQKVGATLFDVADSLAQHTAFVGEVAVQAVAIGRRPSLFRFRETVAQFQSVTVEAIPIVVLVTFLIGVVFAYLLGVQAQRYGATIFVVDGVGLAICRELSPILVAVIVAGRSGAAFTAQIGAMKVQEETDAIRTLGLSPIQVLVIPRLVAIVVGLPLLVFVGDLAGIGGGVLIGALQLGISPPSFVSRLHAVLPLSALVIGIAKAPAFAAFIAMIACRMGMSVERDARSVGENTTSTVVQSIVWVIVLDAIFAVTLQKLDL
jgi:phospholipid/cholesterol/gamma-HCH transport system permease protein